MFTKLVRSLSKDVDIAATSLLERSFDEAFIDAGIVFS
jgi:hypothetical protein